MIKGIQILGLLVSIYLLYRSYTLVKKREEDVKQFLFWIFVAALLLLFSLSPELIDLFLDFLGLKNRTFALIIMGVLLLYFLFFNFTSKLDKLDRQLSAVNEKVSLLEYEMKKSQEE
ncbi:MAG: DUF2304 domain-containing protein [Candidatus Methanofastidiosia archaeon]|jgi:hypothetical protein